jgi:aerobic-type carbon monoxide dehydrogenase small subunit (CoxS/CutS family)
MRISLTVNGEPREADVEPRTLLSDLLRHGLGLTGTKVGCEHGVCGACTVQVEGEPVRSCLMLAVQARGRSVRTIEGLDHPLQRAFHETHALQCGFCTPGILLSLEAFLRDRDDATEEEIREALAGNLCRCTGYVAIVDAAKICCTGADRRSTASRSSPRWCRSSWPT